MDTKKREGRNQMRRKIQEKKTERNYTNFQRRLDLKNVVIPSTSNAILVYPQYFAVDNIKVSSRR